MTDLKFDSPKKGRVARRTVFYLHPELARAVAAYLAKRGLADKATTSHGTWHTPLVVSLLRALLAGDVLQLEKHLESTLAESKLAHARAQAKGEEAKRRNPALRKRRNANKNTSG